jgi:hypothetical protein
LRHERIAPKPGWSVVSTGEIMRRNLIRAAFAAGLFLSLGAAPIFASALDSALQPMASPIRPI